jgi:hypothetical protein
LLTINRFRRRSGAAIEKPMYLKREAASIHWMDVAEGL